MILKKYYCYDIEIMANAFTVVFMNDEEQHIFTIHEDRNQFRELVLFLLQIQKDDYYLVGFNNWSFDYSFIDWILVNYRRYLKTWKTSHQSIIDNLNTVASKAVSEGYYPRHKTKIKQVDLFKIWHFDNRARSCSLKWLEFAMGMDNVEDTPFSYLDSVSLEELDTVVIPYNINDVEATLAFMKKSESEIKHRLIFGDMYNTNFLHHSHTKISKYIFGEALSKELGIDFWELKGLRTKRSSIDLSEVIFPFIEFEDQMFSYLLDKLRNLTIKDTNEINETVEYAGLHFDFGSGGLHAFPKRWEFKKNGERKKNPVTVPSMYHSNDEYQIILVDVSSYYPNIAIQHGIKPAHLGDSFTTVYQNMYDERLKAKYADPKTDFTKAQDLGLKLGLNSVYGLSNDEHSFFYDLFMTVSITINGQLMLTMLAEAINNANIKLIQCNTDGIYVWIKKDMIDQLRELCNQWEDLTKMKLDFDYFDSLVQMNVNNYIGVMEGGYVKEKGKIFSVNTDWHQDHSAKVVKKAIQADLLYNNHYRNYINNHDNLDDFLLGLKLKKNDWLEERYVEDGEYTFKSYRGVVRYAITHDYHLRKVFGKSGNTQAVNKDWKGRVCNDKSTISLDEINRTFYIKEAEKVISQFRTDQMTLF